MTEEKKNPETADLDKRDLNNPRDRDALKKAADDFLKSRKAEAMEEVADEEEINPFAHLVDENAALKDQLLRLAADMENLRKRTLRDVADAKTYAVTNFARDMLGVSDNLRRALDAIPAESLVEDSGLKGLADGVDLTERSMLQALERHGVTKLDPEGQKFDPNFHQAMFEVPNPDVPNNTVVQVVQTGYAIGDRVLRPALVGVSKGGAARAPEADDQAKDA
ncbi:MULTISPECIES: nucleotide exchange factor GrpE [Paenochrobactrum]|uniref:Protein GrpE n=2 Tax=Paenochrobactrum TaxID=999488 RepID=A0A841LYV8_9HYPH|nr:nucleotide exchange factor GrpE [Paenochrobactrum gallinarii]MBB6261712.1 molecular chaperone GrpE [Paenochrobactrum gallinarii]